MIGPTPPPDALEWAREIGKGAAYGVALLLYGLWSERRRKQGSSEHQERLDARDRVFNSALDYRFGQVHEDVVENRRQTDEHFQSLDKKVSDVGGIVGVGSENGLRGDMREMKKAIAALQRDQLDEARRAADRALHGGYEPPNR